MRLKRVNKRHCLLWEIVRKHLNQKERAELRKALSLLGIHPQETRVSLQSALTCHAPLHVWINFQPFTPVLSLVWNSAKNSCKVKVFFQQASFPLGCLHAFWSQSFFPVCWYICLHSFPLTAHGVFQTLSVRLPPVNSSFCNSFTNGLNFTSLDTTYCFLKHFHISWPDLSSKGPVLSNIVWVCWEIGKWCNHTLCVCNYIQSIYLGIEIGTLLLVDWC